MYESIGWAEWSVRRMYSLSASAVFATEFMQTFLDFPQRQQPVQLNNNENTVRMISCLASLERGWLFLFPK
ncbi:MAG: hypothetical protein ACN4GW_11935 [Desulforhopalus sp.]